MYCMDRKWSVSASRRLIADRWIDLRAETCRTPSGQDIDPYYVLSYPDWINVVALTNVGDLVLVRQYRHAARDIFMEIPGGGAEAVDADLKAAAQRELREETGFVAERWDLVASLFPNPSSHTNRVHTFLARGAERLEPQILEAGEEGLEVLVVPVTQVLAGLASGLLGQAMHVSSVLLALNAAGIVSYGGNEPRA